MIKKNKNGFSLIDLLVSISIATLVMSVVLFSYRTFENKLAVSASIQKINTITRQAQRYALSAKETAKGSGNFNTGYGVYFTTTDPKAFYLFADKNGDGVYSGDTSCASGSECIERDLLGSQVSIATLCGTDANAGSQLCPPPGATSASVVFPAATYENLNLNTKITFTNSAGTPVSGTYNAMQVVTNLSDPITQTTAQAGQTVNQAGQITAQDLTSVPTTNHPPVITLLGSNPMNVTIGSTFTDPGATANDTEDGNLTSSIVKTGSVNTLVQGTYTLSYTVTDSGGLSQTVKRSVIVVSGKIYSSTPMPTSNDFVVSGNYLYAVDFATAGKMYVIDVTDSNAPVLVTSIAVGNHPRYIRVVGNYAYIADHYDASLAVVNISNPRSPSLVSETLIPQSNVRSLDASGSYAYTAGYNYGTLGIVRTSDSVLVGQLTTNPWAQITSILVKGNYAYAGGDTDGPLLVVDISNPTAPVEKGRVTLPCCITGIAASGNYVYATSWGYGGISVVDVTNKSTPSLIRTITGINPNYSANAFVYGGYLFVAGDNLTVFDISNPASPVKVAAVSTIAGWEGLYVANGNVYIRDASDNLLIYNLNALISSGGN